MPESLSPLPPSEPLVNEHVKNRQTWIRCAYLVLFAVIFYFAFVLTSFVALVQFLVTLFTGSPVAGLITFGRGLAAYQRQITLFLTFASDDKPFPFTPFPAWGDSGKPSA